jgi:hypothetical protein
MTDRTPEQDAAIDAEFQRMSLWLEASDVVAVHPREVEPDDPRREVEDEGS